MRRAMGATCGNTTYEPTHPLTADALLTRAAREHSYDMADRSFFAHTNPDGDSPGDRIDALGYAWFGWGENISTGSDAEDVMQRWMNSPGHCANIMSPSFEEIGIGFYQNRWTQVFGRPR